MYHSTKLLIRWCWEVIKDRDSLKHVNKVIANTPLGLLCLLHVFFQLAQSTADRKGTAIRQQEAFCMRMHQYGLLSATEAFSVNCLRSVPAFADCFLD